MFPMSKHCREKGESVHDRSWPPSGMETFRFYEDNYEYEIFSMLSSYRACALTSVILVRNRNSHSYSTTIFG